MTMSAECLRAAAASRGSTVSARQPALARSALTRTSTAVSAGRFATFGGLGAAGFFVLAAGGLAGWVGAAVGVGSPYAFSDGVGIVPAPALSDGTLAGTPVSELLAAFLLAGPPPSRTVAPKATRPTSRSAATALTITTTRVTRRPVDGASTGSDSADGESK